ncbi:MAG: hypothetical protein KIS73_27260 [Enhydrobacter sp.]|nr:hypothetical protein [Enhydrobacter sp.]
MTPKPRSGSGAEHPDKDKRDGTVEDTSPASDSAAFMEPEPKKPNDSPLDKERLQTP